MKTITSKLLLILFSMLLIPVITMGQEKGAIEQKANAIKRREISKGLIAPYTMGEYRLGASQEQGMNHLRGGIESGLFETSSEGIVYTLKINNQSIKGGLGPLFTDGEVSSVVFIVQEGKNDIPNKQIYKLLVEMLKKEYGSTNAAIDPDGDCSYFYKGSTEVTVRYNQQEGGSVIVIYTNLLKS